MDKRLRDIRDVQTGMTNSPFFSDDLNRSSFHVRFGPFSARARLGHFATVGARGARVNMGKKNTPKKIASEHGDDALPSSSDAAAASGESTSAGAASDERLRAMEKQLAELTRLQAENDDLRGRVTEAEKARLAAETKGGTASASDSDLKRLITLLEGSCSHEALKPTTLPPIPPGRLFSRPSVFQGVVSVFTE